MTWNIDIEKITAGDLMKTSPVTIEEGASVSEALAKMKKYDVDEIPVIRNNKMIGLLSYVHMTRHRKMMMTSQVEHLMVNPPKVVTNDRIEKVIDALLTHDFTSIPVTSNRKVVGVVSRSCVINSISQHMELMDQDVRSIMTTEPVFTREGENVSSAIHRMISLEENSLPVVNDDMKVVGFVTIKDLTEHLKAPRKTASRYDRKGERVDMNVKVSSVMNRHPVTVGSGATVKDAIGVMENVDVPCTVVDEEGKPIGLISELDLIDIVRRYLKRDDTSVEITGMESYDPYDYQEMYERIRKHLKKIRKMERPLMLTVHVVHHHHEADLSKYTLHGRLNLQKQAFTTQVYDWDLMGALDMLMESFETQLRKYHERNTHSRRKGRRS